MDKSSPTCRIGTPAIVAFLLSLPIAGSAGAAIAPPPAEAPVVVELFTSEGCSSCPPAESVLRRLRASPPAGLPPLILLAHHVDYWDRLGWRDPYSLPEATARQREYARRFRTDPYTPQMVVDGSLEMVGSRAVRIEETIRQSSRAGKATLDLEVDDLGDGARVRLRVGVSEISEVPADDLYEVVAMLTEDGLSSYVTAGENTGRHLEHIGVVRRIRVLGTMRPKDTPTEFRGDLRLDAGWDRTAMRAIVVLQEETARTVVGATEKPLTR